MTWVSVRQSEALDYRIQLGYFQVNELLNFTL